MPFRAYQIESNHQLRSKLIEHIDTQILCINETHLKNNQTISLDGYQFYTFNRQLTHVNAPKGSGGVGIFVHNSLYDVYEINIINRSFDGILGILLKSKQTGYKIVVYSVYLPPENSPWGRNATDFFSHLLGQMYLLSDADAIFVCGDLNSRMVRNRILFLTLMEFRRDQYWIRRLISMAIHL